MERSIVELFAGVGGFRLGFERESDKWNTVWFNQWEPEAKRQWAHECYVRHFGDVNENTNRDIAEVKSFPDFNVLVGGFPCQDYSVMTHGANGIEGKKGVLWWEIYRILKEKRPPFGVFENVDRLIKSPSSQRGRDFGIMLWCLNELGYSAEYRVINAADYGNAQRRRRTFIFIYHNTTKYFKGAGEVLTEGLFARAFPIFCPNSIQSIKLPQSLSGVQENFSFGFENAGFMANGVIFTSKIEPRGEKSQTLGEKLQANVDDKYSIKNIERWEYLKGAKTKERISKSGKPYIYREGAVPFPDPLDKPSRTIITSEHITSRQSHVLLDPRTNKLRTLTPVECERLQGFDDNWTEGMTDTMRYFCMGNALVVPLVTRIAEVLGPIIDQE